MAKRITNRLTADEYEELLTRPANTSSWRGGPIYRPIPTDAPHERGDRPMSFFPPPPRPCSCGSGLLAEDEFDARGIYLCKTCDKCRTDRLAGFRPEVLTDPDYECNEPIEPDGDYGDDW